VQRGNPDKVISSVAKVEDVPMFDSFALERKVIFGSDDQ
jgi:hypothetical protein